MASEDPVHYLRLLKHRSIELFRLADDFPEKDFHKHCVSDHYFRQNILLDLKDIALLTTKIKEVLQDGVKRL